MLLLPFETFTASSPHQRDEVARRLAGSVEKPTTLRFIRRPGSAPLQGHVDGYSFVVWQVPWLGNDGFHVVASGEVLARDGGSVIHVVMRPWLGVGIFLAAVTAGPLVIGTYTLINPGSSLAIPKPFGYFAMAVLMYLLVLAPIRYSMRRAAGLLRAIATL
jgi:hypothetical protein